MNAAAQGDRGAADALMPLVFEQLRRAAQQLMASERPGHTMSATALVHEAYLKLAGPREVPWAGRGHFYSAAAQAMRRILIDHARARGARKAREAGAVRFRDFASLAEQDPEHILAVDDALSRLEDDDPQAAAIVKLRFFAGLSVEQAAEAAGVSPRTAARLWSLARAKLHGFLTETDKDQLHA
jgi:RNA polymerase sigma factor (TIGR02999 family)